MSIIRVLPEAVANRIAAGEVVERPASIVKELVENALDAGATRIRVEVENAGIKRIVVTDNGYGMDEDDALSCFEPHGTSKIATDDDLQRVKSYGFRGEAIPSIASVSRTMLRTKQKDQKAGFEVLVEGSAIKDSHVVGCAQGTEFMVCDLFYNVPARRKFLKTNVTEERHILEVVTNMALPNEQVAFTLLFDGRPVIESLAHSNKIPRMQDFFGKDFTEHMLSLSYEENGIKITGFVARHGYTKTSRRDQKCFVNSRAIESLACFNGIRDGYGSMVEKGMYPPVVLFLEIDPCTLDVNVHPAKREIRFHHEYQVSRAIANAIRQLLEEHQSPTLSVDQTFSLRTLLAGSEVAYRTPKVELPSFHFDESSSIDEQVEQSKKWEKEDELAVKKSEPNRLKEPLNPIEIKTLIPPVILQNVEPLVNRMQGIKAVAILAGCYILATHEEGLVIIDQHAAHERVLFEKFLKQAQNKSEHIISQGLLMGVTIELSRQEAILVEKYTKLLVKAGFELSSLGQTTYLINALPVGMPCDDVLRRFHVLLDRLYDEELQTGKHVQLDSIARAACIAAVKANDYLTLLEADALIEQMSRCDLPFSCPHGRPTLIHFSIKELEKRFSRIK